MASRTDRLIKQFKEPIKKINNAGEVRVPIGLGYLPNHSGDHSRGIVRDTPQSDLDIPNKKYVDDNAGGGSGDVVGPASATDNAICRFNLTTGKLIQDSGVSVNDNNQIQGLSNAITILAKNTNGAVVALAAFNTAGGTSVGGFQGISGADPSFALHGITTIGTDSDQDPDGFQSYIYRADGNDVAIADGGTGVSLLGGATGSRPSSPAIGNTYYDSTLGKLIVYSGSAWVNVDGSAL